MIKKINPRVLMAALAGLVVLGLASCQYYPLGDARYPHYYGGQGSPVQPKDHVPSEVQRNDNWLPLP